MKTKEIIKRARELAEPFRISKGKNFRLKDVDPNDTLEFTKEADKPRAKEALATGVTALAELQDKLYAQDKWAVLLIFQAMDAAGKDGAIKHVMSGINPQGCQVYSFKSPSSEDLDHDYLWRCMKCLPNRGHIGIFNRSYYEEVLVVRVHPDFLAKQKLPPKLVGKNIWDERFEDIRNFEQYLARDAPSYVVPADNKWFTRVVVASAVIETLASLDLAYPEVDESKLKELAAAKEKLLSK
jgi:polyphosphate kinase 2 (PPK2 family)